MFNFETWALRRQQIGCTLKSVFWTDNSCFHRWNLGFQKRHIEIRVFGGQPTLEVWFWWTTEYFQLRSLGLWRKQILRTFNRGLGWHVFSTLIFGFGGDKYFQLGNFGFGEMKCCQLWNLGLEGFSLEMWVWCRKQIFPTLPFVFWGQQQTLSTFAPLGSARTPFPSNFHDLAASRPPTIRFEVFAWEVLQKSTLNQTRFL